MATSSLENLRAAPIFHPANYSPCAKKAVITTLALSIIVTITGFLGLLAATNALPLGSFGAIGAPGAISLTAFGVLASILTLIVTVKALYSQREEAPLPQRPPQRRQRPRTDSSFQIHSNPKVLYDDSDRSTPPTTPIRSAEKRRKPKKKEPEKVVKQTFSEEELRAVKLANRARGEKLTAALQILSGQEVKEGFESGRINGFLLQDMTPKQIQSIDLTDSLEMLKTLFAYLPRWKGERVDYPSYEQDRTDRELKLWQCLKPEQVVGISPYRIYEGLQKYNTPEQTRAMKEAVEKAEAFDGTVQEYLNANPKGVFSEKQKREFKALNADEVAQLIEQDLLHRGYLGLIEGHQLCEILFQKHPELAAIFFPWRKIVGGPTEKSIETWQTLSAAQICQIFALKTFWGRDAIYIWIQYYPHLTGQQKEELKCGNIPASKEDFDRLDDALITQFSAEEVNEMIQAGYFSEKHYALLTPLQIAAVDFRDTEVVKRLFPKFNGRLSSKYERRINTLTEAQCAVFRQLNKENELYSVIPKAYIVPGRNIDNPMSILEGGLLSFL